MQAKISGSRFKFASRVRGVTFPVLAWRVKTDIGKLLGIIPSPESQNQPIFQVPNPPLRGAILNQEQSEILG